MELCQSLISCGIFFPIGHIKLGMNVVKIPGTIGILQLVRSGRIEIGEPIPDCLPLGIQQQFFFAP